VAAAAQKAWEPGSSSINWSNKKHEEPAELDFSPPYGAAGLDNKKPGADATVTTAARPVSDVPVSVQDESKDKANLIDAISKAASSGAAKDLVDQLTAAHKEYGGKGDSFSDLCEQLNQKLANDNISFQHGKNKDGKDFVLLHKNGSASAVELDFDQSQDGSTKGSVSEQTYDWVTKQDSKKDAQEVLSQLKGPADNANLKDYREIYQEWADAYNTQPRDFRAVNKDLEHAARYALAQGGLPALKQLDARFRDGNLNTKAEDPKEPNAYRPFLEITKQKNGDAEVGIVNGRLLTLNEKFDLREHPIGYMDSTNHVSANDDRVKQFDPDSARGIIGPKITVPESEQ
jgi:hypothetical protein